MLYWGDALGEALAFARRSCLVGDRAVERPVPGAWLQLAEILLLLEQYEEAARLVEAMRATTFRLDPDNIPSQKMLELVLSELGISRIARPEGGWEQTMRLAEENGLRIEEQLTLLYWRARMALVGDRLEEASAALSAARSCRAGCSMWLSRFEALEAQLAQAQGALRRRSLEGRGVLGGSAAIADS
jgi:hypothetical protein